MENAKDRAGKAGKLTLLVRNLQHDLASLPASAFPAPEPAQVRCAAFALLVLSILQLGRALFPDSIRPAMPPSVGRCRTFVQVGGPTGRAVCLDAGREGLHRAGLDRCCLPLLRTMSVRSGDRLVCRRKKNGCRLERHRMNAALLETLQVVLDLNAAPEWELKTIEGIGPTLANRIVTFRKTNGPFKSLEGLLEVKGVSRRRLDRIRARLVVVTPTRASPAGT